MEGDFRNDRSHFSKESECCPSRISFFPNRLSRCRIRTQWSFDSKLQSGKPQKKTQLSTEAELRCLVAFQSYSLLRRIKISRRTHHAQEISFRFSVPKCRFHIVIAANRHSGHCSTSVDLKMPPKLDFLSCHASSG